MTTIYRTLNTKIRTILESATKIKSIYAYPARQIDSYPSAIFYPSSLGNDFETTTENIKNYGYKLYIVINAEATTVENIFNTIMPNVVDQVLEELDNGWNFDSIDGHRVWAKVETGEWGITETNAGLEVYAEINLSIKLLTN